jgi:hypothetical protein
LLVLPVYWSPSRQGSSAVSHADPCRAHACMLRPKRTMMPGSSMGSAALSLLQG